MKLEELKNSHLHFIGMGGSGMSGLARISIALGIPTSGSDAKNSSALESLKTLGAQTFIGHSSSQIKDAYVVVVSSAIGENNPELVAAKKLNAVILTRAQLLAIFMQGQKSVAVAGTHGKTTTTSALTVALQSMGLNPSFAIGGTINASGINAHNGKGNFFIAEADESDGSFLAYKPTGAIITNIELDHVDHFKNLADVEAAFLDFVNSIAPNGFLVADISDPAALASMYETSGANMISVLTEEDYFKGSIEDLTAVTDRVSIPVLRKEFIANEYQILEARAYGADVVLLIVAGLDNKQLANLYHFSHSIGLSVLVETHSEAELHVAFELGAKMIGINARDLNTFETDLTLYSQLCSRLPKDVVAVAESAVRGVAEVREYALSGADAVLVGEALVTGDPSELIPEFKSFPKTRI